MKELTRSAVYIRAGRSAEREADDAAPAAEFGGSGRGNVMVAALGFQRGRS